MIGHNVRTLKSIPAKDAFKTVRIRYRQRRGLVWWYMSRNLLVEFSEEEVRHQLDVLAADLRNADEDLKSLGTVEPEWVINARRLDPVIHRKVSDLIKN